MSQHHQHATSPAIPCPAGLRLIGDTPALWIQSPRTGRRVTITNGFWAELPGRMSARVIRAASTGCRLVGFTRDELAAVKDLADRIAARCQPVPLHGDWNHRRPSRSFSGHRTLRRV